VVVLEALIAHPSMTLCWNGEPLDDMEHGFRN
jgi:hypothetical protein